MAEGIHLSDEGKASREGSGTEHVDYEYAAVCEDPETEKVSIINGSKCEAGHYVIAVGRYANKVNETGWGILEIETNSNYDDDYQAYGAGYIEGHLTRKQIRYNYENTVAAMVRNQSQFQNDRRTFLRRNLQWMSEQVDAVENKGDPFWKQLKLTFHQLTGLSDSFGGRDAYPPHIAFLLDPIYSLQFYGDMFDLQKFLNNTTDPMAYPEARMGSALVKLAPGNKDFFLSHVTMGSLSTMNRVLKLYKFGYSKTMSFSGYAGIISSGDEFTLTSAGLASIATTFTIFKDDVYRRNIKSEDLVFSWIRSFIANSISTSAKGWVDQFARYNSGTYNGQWVIVDYKHFTPCQPLPDNDVIWVIEQFPGHTEQQDLTSYLKNISYFPSHNIPYMNSIRELAGYKDKEETYNWYKWGRSPRAQIFDRDHHKVVDIDSLTKLMRYNDYEHDQFALCKCSPNRTAVAGISSRGDLNLADGEWEVPAMGFHNQVGLDFKGTNYEMFKNLRFRAWGGPTYDPLPPFDWRTTRIKSLHYGQPELWNFKHHDLVWEAKVGVNGMH